MTMPRRAHLLRTATVLAVAALALLAACDDGRRVESRHASELRDDGTRTYRIEVTDTPTIEGATFEHTGRETDDWVRHCFEPAEVGSKIPFYCTSGRTVTELAVAAVAALASVPAVWLISAVVGMRVPEPAPAAPLPSDASLFRRAEAEKQSHQPVWRAHWRMAVTGYAARVAGGGFVAALALALVAGLVGPDWLGELIVAAGLLNLIAFAGVYVGWSIRRDHLDDVTHARLTFALGVGLGLLLAGMILEPPFEPLEEPWRPPVIAP